MYCEIMFFGLANDKIGGISATAAETFIIDNITWLRMSASFVFIFLLIDCKASKHSSCKK